jgi:hypothetical protein
VRFLADHNVEALIVERLREAGHEVLTVADLGETRAEDQAVLSRADWSTPWLSSERLLGSMIVVGERTIRRRRLPGL